MPRVLTDDEVFGPLPQQTTSIAPAPAAVQAQPRVLSDADVFGPDNGPGAITRGFVTGLAKENPEMFAEALEGASHMAGDDFRESLLSASRDLRSVAGLSPEEYARRTSSMWNVRNFDEALTWAGEALGSGMASTLPSLVTGVTGSIIGGRLGGRTGAIVGGMGGATIPSSAQNYGEIYKALKDEKVDPKLASEYALYATPILAGLDLVSIGPIISRLGGVSEVKKEIARGLARRIASEGLRGASREGVTESLQEMVKNATTSLAANKDFFTTENAKGWLEAAVAGSLPGGAIGGVTGVVPDRSVQAPATPEEIAIARSVLSGQPGPQTAPTPRMPMAVEDLLNIIQELPQGPVQGPLTPEQIRAQAGTDMATALAGQIPGQPSTPPAARTPDQALDNIEMSLGVAPPTVPPNYAPQTPTAAPSVATPVPPPEPLIAGRTQADLLAAFPNPPHLQQPVPATPPMAAPLEGEILPPQKKADIPADVVRFVHGNMDPLTVPTKPSSFSELLDKNRPMKEEIDGVEEIEGHPGTDIAGLFGILGQNLYGSPKGVSRVTVKELFQNSYDAIKNIIKNDPKFKGNLDIQMDPKARTVTVVDNGSGISPEILSTKFLEIAGTFKESDRNSGGFGIAKMMWMFENKRMQVMTARDGKIATMTATGEELKAAAEKQGPKPKIQIRKMTREDYKTFPQGHGTKIEVQIPETYEDVSTGKIEEVDFDDWEGYHPSLRESPLFDNIDVRFNGRPIPVGSAFPYGEYSQLTNVNFNWGTARIYVSKAPYTDYHNNTTILSNGIYQFSFNLKDAQNKKLPRKIYVDVSPKVTPRQPGYPFAPNRQEFSPIGQKDFAQLFNYLRLYYQQADLDMSVENFGGIQFLDFDTTKGSVVASGERKLTPPKPTSTDKPQGKIGNQVTIKDGKMIVDGKEIPELSLEDLENFSIDISKLKIPQSEIDPNAVIMHDVVEVPATGTPLDMMGSEPVVRDPLEQRPFAFVDPQNSDIPKVSLTQLGAEKFGGRFYEYIYLIGAHFRELRDVVATYKVQEPGVLELGAKDYSTLKDQGIGISFGPDYRGISIRLPFSASFINPAVPIFTDPLRAPVGMIGTMIHEFAHLHVRGHNATFPAAMQDIIAQLETDPNFNFQNFKQRMVNVHANYKDVFEFLNGAYSNGLVTASGKRFKDSSDQSLRNGGTSGNLGEPATGTSRGFELRDWVALGQSAAGSRSGDTAGRAGITSAGSGRDPSFGENANQRALDSEARGVDAAQWQEEFLPSRQAVSAIFGGTTPKPVAATLAHADRMNRVYKYMAGLTQLNDANPRFTPLNLYTETVRAMHNYEAQWQDAALRIGKDWRDLGEQAENLSRFLNDLTRMVYRTPDEIKKDVERHPTAAEFDALVAKHKLSGSALKVYGKVKAIFNRFIDEVVANQIDKSTRLISDPVKKADLVDKIRLAGAKLKEAPYFPFMNFGKHFVQVRNSAGEITEFYTFERQGFRSAERMQQNAKKRLEKRVAAAGRGETVRDGIIPEVAEPFIGMPPQLLEAIKNNLGLTPDQLDALDQMRLQSGTNLSFRARFSNKKVMPGYSMDFKRAFAKYFFHGARFLARTKYANDLRDQIKLAEQVPGNKASMIRDYMADHLRNAVLDAKGDFGLVKAGMFLFAMGFVPAAALQNMSQTPMITYPFLWGKFGNVAAVKALTVAMKNLDNFYKKGFYEGMADDRSAEFELRAIDYGIKTGRITETQAPELAGLAQGEGLLRGVGGNAAQQFSIMVQEKAAWMFEMAEQFNRRIAYRAGLYLGQTRPNAKETEVAIKKYAQEYQELQVGGRFTPAQARAIVTAIHIVDQTQFVYARYARARFMRGRLPGTVFVFKQYMQSALMMLAHNKRDVLPRAMLMFMLMGGLAALPGWEDLREIIKGVARWKFGKDFDVEKELRTFIMSMSGEEHHADLVLHGFARKGFGVPALLDAMGSLYTGRPGRGLASNTPAQNIPFPVVDMSRAISMGNVLPVELGKLINPDKPTSTIAEQTQKASGAAFSVGFNLYKALWDNRSLSDPKRWEKAVPRMLAATSRMFRSYAEGGERMNSGGPLTATPLVKYDVRDTEHLMELLAVGAGFQTERISSRWDRVIAQMEGEKFFEMRRKGLLTQYHEAYLGGIEQERQDVIDLIRQFNDTLPERARGYKIDNDVVKRSMQARERVREAGEAGMPTRRQAIPMKEYYDSLFPNVPVDMRAVR